MLSYHYVPEELNKRVLRILHMALLAYALPLWMQLIYLGDAGGATGETVVRIVIWNLAMHPVTVTLLRENLVMFAYVAVLEIVQERVRNIWLYLGAHLGCVAAMWHIIPSSAGNIPRLIICIVFLVCAFYARIHETHMGYPTAVWLAIGLLMVVTSSQADLQDMQTVGCAMEAATTVLCALYYNVVSVDHALEHSRGGGGVPYDRVRQINLLVMILWLLAGAGVTLIIILSGIGNALFDELGDGFLWCLRQILRFAAYLLSLLPQVDKSYQGTAGMMESFDQGDVDPVVSILMIILMAIWETILALYRLVAFVLAVWALVQCCRWLYRAFQAADPEDRRPLTWQTVTERVSHVIARGNQGLSPLDPSPAARIRRSYIRFIRKGAGFRNIRECMTAEELLTVSVNFGSTGESDDPSVRSRGDGQNLPGGTQERLYQIRILYERARYVPEQCTRDDVIRMQRLTREYWRERVGHRK